MLAAIWDFHSNHLQHRRKQSQYALHCPHCNISASAEFQCHWIAVIQGICKVFFNIPDHLVAVNPHSILKVKIKAAVIQVNRSHHANLIIAHKGLCMKKSRLILINLYPSLKRCS